MIPASKFASEVLRVMQKHRFIGEFEQVDDGRSGKFRIQLLAKINKCGIVTPRFSVKKGGYLDWERQVFTGPTIWEYFLCRQAKGLCLTMMPKINVGGGLNRLCILRKKFFLSGNRLTVC